MKPIELLQELQGNRSQEEFAQLLGVTQVHVSYVLSGKRNAGRKMLRGLVRAFPERQAEIVSCFFARDYRDCDDNMADAQSAPAAEAVGEEEGR